MSIHSFPYLISSSMVFSSDEPAERLVLDLISNRWVQRLRRIAQSGAQKFVFMFSEHSRFGHAVHSAYLMSQVIKVLRSKGFFISDFDTKLLLATSLLHDIGHLAPGSHMAWDIWFPKETDQHEKLGVTIIGDDSSLHSVLKDQRLIESCQELLLPKHNNLAPWMYQLISGKSWNIDRGSWVLTDAILSGFGLGMYNVTDLINSIKITEAGLLDFDLKKQPTLENFLVARNTLYSQVMFHPAVIGARLLYEKVVERLREGAVATYLDETMQKFLLAKTSHEVKLEDIFKCDDNWFYYHLSRWCEDGNDNILKDLSLRILNRDFFTCFRLSKRDFAEKHSEAAAIVESHGLNLKYYCLTETLDDCKAIISQSPTEGDKLCGCDNLQALDCVYLYLPSGAAKEFESRFLKTR